MSSQVGVGEVAIVPRFTGFRKTTDREVSAAERSASNIFTRGFSRTGQEAGSGFSKAFKSASSDATSKLTADVARAARDVSNARLKEQDAAGKARVAEAQLADARRRFTSDSAQVVRAEERLASTQRTLSSAQDSVKASTDRLASAQRSLASASDASSMAAGGWRTRFTGIFRGAGEESASSFGGGFRNAFGTIFAGATLANLVTQGAYAVGRGISDALQAGFSCAFGAFNAAADLEQSVGAVEAVFAGAGAEQILTFSEKAARNVGLAKTQYQQFATVVGSQLKNLGIPLDQVSGKTNDLITLGADLAAQFSGPVDQAVGAISSLLRGERDPIERYGVSLKQVDIDARKAAMGLDGLEGELDKQATIQATLALLYEQTASAQGTFNRETDTAAHKQQVLQARLEDTKTRFGEALLGPGTEFLDFADGILLPKLDQVLGRLGPQLGAALDESRPAIEKTLDALSDMIPPLIDFGSGALPIVADSLEGDAKFLSDTQGVFERTNQFFTDYLPRWAAGEVSVQESWEGFFNWFDYVLDGHASNVHNKSEETKKYWTSGVLSTLQELEGKAQDWIELGNLYGDGLAEGFRQRRSTVYEAAALLAGEAVFASKNVMGVKSPSRVARYFAHMWGDGLDLGFGDKVSTVERSALRLANAAIGQFAAVDTYRLQGSSSGSGDSTALPPIYVQNPFTGEYLLARVDERADGRIAHYDARSEQVIRNGRKR